MTHGEKVVAVLRNLLVEKYGAATQANWAKLDGPQVAAAIDKAFPEMNSQRKPVTTQAEWIASLKASPEHQGVDIDGQFDRFKDWCHRCKIGPTRNLFEKSFLKNAQKIVDLDGRPAVALTEIRGWLYLLKELRAEGLYHEAIPPEWEELSDDTKRVCHNRKKHAAELAAFAERNSGEFYARLKQIEERNQT